MFSVVLKWADQDLEASLQSADTKVNTTSIGASLEVNIQNHQQGNFFYFSLAQFLRACLLLIKMLMLLPNLMITLIKRAAENVQSPVRVVKIQHLIVRDIITESIRSSRRWIDWLKWKG